MKHTPGARGAVLLVACALTLLNALKPVTVDDPALLRQAAWWAAHPASPLGGEAFLYQSLVPAAKVSAAPVGIAWLALGMRVVGSEPWALKLWLFPVAWLLCAALAALLRRVSPALAPPLLALVALSPALLPSFNFMLDLPALALALAALEGFAAARGARGALGAGVLAGLALQTKYTAAPVTVALAALALASGRARLGALAIGAAAAVFAGIECALFTSARTSPLLEYFAGRGARDPAGHHPLLTAKRLVLLAGGAGAPLVPLALAALGAPRRAVRAALAAVVGGFALLALAPAPLASFLDGVTGGRVVNLENVSIAWLGPALLVTGGFVAWRAVRERHASGANPLAPALVAWLVAECALAPFVSASASARRALGALVALALLVAFRLARAVERDPALAAEVRAIAAASVVLGVAVWAVDLDSALAERGVLAAALARASSGGRTAAVGDHWGAFQYAASRAGLERIAADRDPLARGDRLIVASGVEMRGVELDASKIALRDSVVLRGRLPLTTRHAFYDGRLVVRRAEPDEVGARIYEVTASGIVLRTRRPRD